MKRITLASIILSFLLYCNLSVAQSTDITDPNVVNLPEVNRCDGSTTVTVDFVWGATGTEALITATLPTGFSYTAGTISGTDFSESDLSDPSNPVFAFANPVSSAMNTLSFDVAANCDAIDGTPSIGIAVDIDGNGTTGVGGGTGNVSVRLVSASLSFSSTHTLQTVSPGEVNCVDVVITNGGLGSLDSLVFSVTENGTAQTDSIMIGALTIVGSGPYVLGEAELVAAGVGTSLENGESITISRCYTITGCAGTLPNSWTDTYTANYGCPGSCQNDAQTNGSFNIPDGEPLFSSTANLIQQTNKCDDLIFEYTITNNGNGAASLGTATDLSLFYEDTPNVYNVIMAEISDGMGGYVSVPFTGSVARTSLSSLTTNPDDAGGLEDLDGDGEFDDLAVGESFMIRYTLEYLCNLSCDSRPTYDLDLRMDYNDICGNPQNVRVNRSLGVTSNSSLGPGVSSSVVASPPGLSEGQSSTIELCFDITPFGNHFSCATDEYELTFNYNNSNVSIDNVVLDGSTNAFTDNAGVSFTTLLNGGGAGVQCIQIEFTAEVGICPISSLDFDYELNHTCDAACADCTTEVRTCGNLNVAIFCPGPCPLGGIAMVSSSIARTTFGFTDETGTTTVDPTTLPAISLLRAQACDSVEICATGVQRLGSVITTGNTAYLAVSYDQFAGNDAFVWLGGATASITPASGTGVMDIDIGAPITDATINGQHVVYYDLGAALTAYGSDLAANDTISVKMQGIVQDEDYDVNTNQVGDFGINFFNLDPTDVDPDPETDTQYSCGGSLLEFYLRETEQEVIASSQSFNNCNARTFNITFFSRRRGDAGIAIDFFPDEVRPIIVVDSVVLRLPNYLTYNNSATIEAINATDGNYPASVDVSTPAAVRASGNDTIYVFANDGTWPLMDENGELTTYRLIPSVFANCLFNSGVAADDEYSATYYGKDNVNSGNTDCYTSVQFTGNRSFSGRIGESRITNLTGTVVGDEAQECFQINVAEFRNRGGTAATLVFPETGTGGTVVSVTEGGMPLTLLPYADGQYIELDDNVTALEEHDLEVCISYDNCDGVILPVQVYNDCAGFLDPENTICVPDVDTLRIAPIAEGEVQLDFISQPPSVIDLCQEYSYSIRLNSAQAASIVDPNIEFTLPTGLTLVGTTAEVFYPSDAAASEAITIVNMSGTYSIDLTDHTAITANNNSIDGVGAAASNADRQVIINFDIITDCSYQTNGFIPFTVNAGQPCGDPAVGAGNAINSAPLNVTNSEVTYNSSVNINSNPTFMCPDDVLTIPIDFMIMDKSDAGNVGTVLGTNDQVEVVLSAGLDYVDASLSTMDGLTFVSESVDASGNTVVVFAFPSTTIPDQGSANFAFEIDVALNSDAACGDMFVSSTTVTSLVSGQPCATEMSGVCPGDVTISTGSSTNSLSV